MTNPVVAGTPGRSARTVNLALATLALVTFVIGTAELMIVGILDLIATDTEVSIGTAGHLVTAYAIGIAVGAPLITAATTRYGRRAVLCVALLAFVAGNVVAATATGFELVLVARVATGSLHGLIAGVATSLAAGMVPVARRGQAISLVVGGITVSTVVGVPAGTVIGHALGWRAAFIAVIALSGVAIAAMLRFVPEADTPDATGVGVRLRAAFAPRTLAVLGAGFVVYAGQFTGFTYLAPFLDHVTGVSSGLTSLYLLAFGLAALIGTLIGGRLADKSAPRTLSVATAVLAVALLAVHLVGDTPALALLAVAVWGLAGFAVAPALLVRALDIAGGGAELVPTLVISSVNAGIAAGSIVGGAVIGEHGAGATILAALIIVAAAVPVVWASGLLRVATPPTVPPAREVAEPTAPLAAACMCRLAPSAAADAKS